MAPRARSRSAAAALASRKVAVRLVASTRFQVSSGSPPAARTRRCRHWTRSRRCARAAHAPPRRAAPRRPRCRRRTGPPRRRLLRERARRPRRRCPRRATCQPRAARWRAMPAPMPCAAPVTITARCARSSTTSRSRASSQSQRGHMTRSTRAGARLHGRIGKEASGRLGAPRQVVDVGIGCQRPAVRHRAVDQPLERRRAEARGAADAAPARRASRTAPTGACRPAASAARIRPRRLPGSRPSSCG